jgi:3-phenylpropionate/trans-cinnamate dioxygenase ferredoxin reductase subunit
MRSSPVLLLVVQRPNDCSRHPSAYAGRRIRLESVPSALEQARSAAAWFWSDQCDLKLQMVGLNQGYDTLVLRGSPANRNFLAFYLKDGVLLAVDPVSIPQEFMIAKKLVAEKLKGDVAQLADESRPLKELLAPAA